MNTLFATEKVIVRLLNPNDKDQFKELVSNKKFVEDVGKGLSDEIINKFINQPIPQTMIDIGNSTPEQINAFLRDPTWEYLTFVVIPEQPFLLGIFQLARSSENTIRYSLMLDPQWANNGFHKDIVDRFLHIIFNTSDYQNVETKTQETREEYRTLLLAMGFHGAGKDIADIGYTSKVCIYKMNKNHYLDEMELRRYNKQSCLKW